MLSDGNYEIVQDMSIRAPEYRSTKALHLSARGVTTVPSSNPNYHTSSHDCESHRVTHNWASVIRVWPG